MYSFNIVLTEICNATCSHCYMANSNMNKKTMLEEEIDKIINKMPKNTKRVVFTGGEIFLVNDLLEFCIKKIVKKSLDIEIGLESNGIYFYKDLKRAKKELYHLKQMGVDFIRFSDDPFHASGGVDLNKVRELKKLQDNNTPVIKYLIQNDAVAIGKAQNLPDNLKAKKDCMNNEKTIDNPYLFLDVNGNVYICTWKCIPPIGNMITDEWSEIESALNTDFNKLILLGKIEDAISLVSSKEKEKNKEYSSLNGQCMLCYKFFSRR